MKYQGVSAAEKDTEGPRPLCDCHQVGMHWNRSSRYVQGGRWQCSIKNRERARRWREANPERNRETKRRHYEANREKVKARVRDYYHRPYGGWFKERQRDLAAQRVRVLEQLAEVQEVINELVARH